MFNRVVIEVVPDPSGWPERLRFLVDGEDLAAGAGATGSYAHRLLPPTGPSPLDATAEGRRVVLGEATGCVGECCGFLAMSVRRAGGLVEWADWAVPYEEARPPALHIEADLYDVELARAVAAYRGRTAAAG
ncbi:hypothetical protein [Kitasatospora camelliae]|uniref:Uncharacterized protein n=1 Tax=Kitasatospora camelliae TaxID=3156397 RepID=A0AAU8JPY3_9ACTN